MVKVSFYWLHWRISYDATNLKSIVEFNVTTWSIVTGLVTFIKVIISQFVDVVINIFIFNNFYKNFCDIVVMTTWYKMRYS